MKYFDFKYDMWELKDSKFLENLFTDYHKSKFIFTDVILIGGDGLFHQYVNATMSHDDFDVFRDIPITILPSGNTNSVAYDLNCSDPYLAIIKCLRQITIKSDLAKVTFDDYPIPVYGTAVTWGARHNHVENSKVMKK